MIKKYIHLLLVLCITVQEKRCLGGDDAVPYPLSERLLDRLYKNFPRRVGATPEDERGVIQEAVREFPATVAKGAKKAKVAAGGLGITAAGAVLAGSEKVSGAVAPRLRRRRKGEPGGVGTEMFPVGPEGEESYAPSQAAPVLPLKDKPLRQLKREVREKQARARQKAYEEAKKSIAAAAEKAKASIASELVRGKFEQRGRKPEGLVEIEMTSEPSASGEGSVTRLPLEPGERRLPVVRASVSSINREPLNPHAIEASERPFGVRKREVKPEAVPFPESEEFKPSESEPQGRLVAERSVSSQKPVLELLRERFTQLRKKGFTPQEIVARSTIQDDWEVLKKEQFFVGEKSKQLLSVIDLTTNAWIALYEGQFDYARTLFIQAQGSWIKLWSSFAPNTVSISEFLWNMIDGNFKNVFKSFDGIQGISECTGLCKSAIDFWRGLVGLIQSQWGRISQGEISDNTKEKMGIQVLSSQEELAREMARRVAKGKGVQRGLSSEPELLYLPYPGPTPGASSSSSSSLSLKIDPYPAPLGAIPPVDSPQEIEERRRLQRLAVQLEEQEMRKKLEAEQLAQIEPFGEKYRLGVKPKPTTKLRASKFGEIEEFASFQPPRVFERTESIDRPVGQSSVSQSLPARASLSSEHTFRLPPVRRQLTQEELKEEYDRKRRQKRLEAERVQREEKGKKRKQRDRERKKVEDPQSRKALSKTGGSQPTWAEVRRRKRP